MLRSVAAALNSRCAEVYHIGFPVVARSDFGMYGAYYAVTARTSTPSTPSAAPTPPSPPMEKVTNDSLAPELEQLPAIVPISFDIGTAKTGSASATRKKPGNNVFHSRKRPQKQIGSANVEDRKDSGAYEAGSKRERKKVHVEQ